MSVQYQQFFDTCVHRLAISVKHGKNDIGHYVFARSLDGEKIGYSIEDKMFLDLMDHEFSKTSDGNWIGPLPFRSPRPRLANNKNNALKRAHILQK